MEFFSFQKIGRFDKEIVVTEKIDGTNAQIYIEDIPKELYKPEPGLIADDGFGPETCVRVIRVGSRNRQLMGRGKEDNFGFYGWASDNAECLMQLGPGRHYGEWWGHGIQRGYDLEEKRFSLFNTDKWGESRPDCCHVVPIIHKGRW